MKQRTNLYWIQVSNRHGSFEGPCCGASASLYQQFPDPIKVDAMNVLFVCSMNKWRSPTAEKIYAKHPGVTTRSCGTSKNARRTISERDLNWADIILVMENKHRNRIRSRFPGHTAYSNVVVLDIPDEYQFMDQELIDSLRNCVDPLLAD